MKRSRPAYNLIVETDGWQAHGHGAAFEEANYRPRVVRIAQCTPHHALATPPAGG